MKRSFLLVLASVITIAGNCVAGQQAAPPRATAGSFQVSGTVVNAVTREPLAGVTVVLAPNVDAARQGVPAGPRAEASAPEVPPVLTAGDGSFSFAGLKPGKYSLSGAKRGFSRQGFNQHEQYSSAIAVGPGKDSVNLLFLLQPDASISGRIVDEHNDPVANAQVLLFREGLQNGRRGIYRAQQVQSSDDGTYRVPRLRPGKYYIAVSATPWYAQYQNSRPGRFSLDASAPSPQQLGESSSELDFAFPLTLFPGVTDSARAEAIELRAGQRENVDFALTAVPSLHIRVSAPPGEGQQFVTANLVQQVFDNVDVAGANMRGRNMSFGQGVTEIAGIAPGHYLLQLRINGPNRTPVPIDVRELDIASNLEINATEVPPGVNVSGTLRFEGPVPQEPVRLVLRRKSFPQPVQLQISAGGVISSEGPVPPGTYDLSLAMNYALVQIGVKGGKLTGQSIQVGSDDVKLTLVAAKASGRVEGVAMKDGKPLAGVMLVLVPQDTDRLQLYRRDQSDSDGTFALPAIPPGKYTVLALENGWDMEWSKAVVLSPYFASGETVQVAADGKYQITATVQ